MQGAMDVFIWTAKINRKKILLVLATAIAAVAVIAAILSVQLAPVSGTVSSKKVKSEEERIAYLQNLGWQVSPNAVLTEELLLPEKFTSEYDQYLALQAEQGFNLQKYAGKRIHRYTYEILNYPTGETEVTVHLLVYHNRVIGGELLGAKFLTGLCSFADAQTHNTENVV